MKSEKLDAHVNLRYFFWQASAKDILRVARAYCVCLSDSELASRVMELATKIDFQYENHVSAQEIDVYLVELKEIATGIPVDDAELLGITTSIDDIKSFHSKFKNQISVDPLMKEVRKNYE